jgi:plastocyanin
MKHSIAVAAAVAALLLGAALAAPAADVPKPPVVHIKNFAYVPATLTVPPGTTVTFVNDDEEPHTVTATNKSFDSEALDSHQSWKYAFAKSGSFTYFCEMHPYMKGTVTVKTGGAQ